MKKQLKWIFLVIISMLLFGFGLIGMITLIVTYSESPESISKIASAISAVIGLVASLIAFFASIVAIAAVNVWKNKLAFQKKYDLIWDAQEHLSKFKTHYLNCLMSAVGTLDNKLLKTGCTNKLFADIEKCEEFQIQLQRVFSNIDFLVLPHQEAKIFRSWSGLLNSEWGKFKKYILETNGADLLRAACAIDGTKSCMSELDKLVEYANENLHQAYGEI